MRIELVDINGSARTIDTANPHIIAEWFKEYIPHILADTINYHYEWRIRIWPNTREEQDAIKTIGYNDIRSLNYEGLIEIANAFVNAANQLKKVGK